MELLLFISAARIYFALLALGLLATLPGLGLPVSFTFTFEPCVTSAGRTLSVGSFVTQASHLQYRRSVASASFVQTVGALQSESSLHSARQMPP